MQLWLCPLFAFLLGSIPFGLFISRSQGIDIRQHGSGNIGATNVLRVMGKKFGITCLILDALKGYLPTLLAITLIAFGDHVSPLAIKPLTKFAYIFPADQQWQAQTLHVLTGLLAILGHNYSPWVGFKGGKGIATSAGVIIALAPLALVVLLIVWLLVFLISRYVSLASIVAAAALPLTIVWGSYMHGNLQAGTWNKPLLAFSILIAALAIWKHRSNIQRLMNGTENRFTRKPKADV